MVLRSSSSVFLFHASFSYVKEESRIFQLNSLQLSVSLSALAPVNVVPIPKKSTLYKHLHTHTKTKHFSFPKTSFFCRSFAVEDNHRQAISSFQHSEYHTANQKVERPDLDEKTGLCQEESP